jgi:hypothetical protein
MRNFLITAMGRSGTRFLAENMNKSEKWTVLHEAGRWHDMKRTPKELNKRFARNYYGEVNGYLRFISDRIRVEKRGVILREPEELWFSITTWHKWLPLKIKQHEKWMSDLAGIKRAIPHLLNLVESGRYYVINFERMTTEKEYLKDIFLHFGIDDVKVTRSMLYTKINRVPEGVERTTWADFGPKVKDEIMRLKDMYLKRTEKIFGVTDFQQNEPDAEITNDTTSPITDEVTDIREYREYFKG